MQCGDRSRLRRLNCARGRREPPAAPHAAALVLGAPGLSDASAGALRSSSPSQRIDHAQGFECFVLPPFTKAKGPVGRACGRRRSCPVSRGRRRDC